MKRVIFLMLISFITFSCSKKEIKIPVIAATGIQEVLDHSQVWIFSEDINGEITADINRKNTISSTNWIYNIDRNLPLYTFVNSLSTLQEKHSGSIHSKKGKHDYFSYSDAESEKLSFITFTEVTYKTDSILSKYFIKENSKDYLRYNNINLTFNPNNIWINDGKFEKDDFKTLLLEYIDFSAEGSQTMLHINYNDRLLYKDYLYYKTMLNRIKNEAILINPIEFVFNQEKVPDCGCE
jgi:hypothetical protein